MSRRGRKPWNASITAPLQALIDDELRAAALSVREIYDQHNLRRFATWHTFRQWAKTRQRELGVELSGADASPAPNDAAATGPSSSSSSASASDSSADCSPGTPPSAANADGLNRDMLLMTLQSMTQALLAGRCKPGHLASFMDSAVRLEKLRLDEQATRRANELHEAKMTELRGKMRAAVKSAEDAGQKSFSRDDVYDMIDRVMRGEA